MICKSSSISISIHLSKSFLSSYVVFFFNRIYFFLHTFFPSSCTLKKCLSFVIILSYQLLSFSKQLLCLISSILTSILLDLLADFVLDLWGENSTKLFHINDNVDCLHWLILASLWFESLLFSILPCEYLQIFTFFPDLLFTSFQGLFAVSLNFVFLDYAYNRWVLTNHIQCF